MNLHKENLNQERLLKQDKLLCCLVNVKSKYILKKMFGNLQKKKSFEIINYNNKLQDRLDININNYKQLNELLYPVEIEVIPADNKFGNFINIVNKEEKSYFHFRIYLNNNSKKLQRNFITKDDKIKKIKILIENSMKTFNDLFYLCDCVESINFIRFNRNDIKNMKYMFYGCSSLKEINLSKFNTENVTNMFGMFAECKSIKNLNLSSFITYKVTNMKYMFFNCISLEKLYISSFRIINVTDMSYMFYNCFKLIYLDISNFYSYNRLDKYFMFDGCSKELISRLKALNQYFPSFIVKPQNNNFSSFKYIPKNHYDNY